MTPAWLAICASLVASGCTTPVTEIFACYGVEPGVATEPGDSGGALSVHVETADGTQPLYASEIGSLETRFASQGFVRVDHDGVLITLSASIVGVAGDETVTQAARVAFRPDRIVDVTLWIEAACRGLVCGLDETCVAGRCEPVDVEAECLADRGTDPTSACTDARVRRACDAAGPTDGGA